MRRPREPRRPRGVAGVRLRFAGLALLLCVLTACAAAGTAPGRPSTGFTVTMGASPGSGTAPLQVAFSEQVSSGFPTLYNWSFGDGAQISGGGSSYSRPVHTYESGGSYQVHLEVWEGSSFALASRAITVAASPLKVVATASTLSGSAPLTVVFRANASGGAGTYVNYSWQLGNGGEGSGPLVAYTYLSPGSYDVSVVVLDATGNATRAELRVQVQGPPAEWLGLPPWELEALVLVVGAAAAAAFGYRWVRRRSPPSSGPEEAREGSSAQGAWSTWSEGGTPGAGGGGADPDVATDPATTPGPPDNGRPEVDPIGPSGLSEAKLVEGRTVSRRLVPHLAGLGPLGPEDIPDSRWTQSGLAEALGISQNRVSNVLRRLVAAGIVVEELRHVSRRPRRVKVYLLTNRGQALADSYRAADASGPPDGRG
jgi:hypothetical protein